MRIGFIVVKNILRGGGIEKYTYEVGRRLMQRGHDVVVFSMGHYGEFAAEVEGMRIVRVPCARLAIAEKTTASAIATLRALAYRPKIDVLHFHSVAAGSFGVLPRLLGRPTILQMHGVEWQRSRWGGFGQRVLHMMERVSLAVHSNCTAVSRTQCDFYRERYGKEMEYIPTAAELTDSADATDEIELLGLEPDRYVLFAARLVAEKGAHYLIEAFRKLHTDWKLVIAGSAQGEEEYQESLHTLAAGDPRIIFPGYVEGEAKHQLFSHAGLYVQPSEIEGLSISLLEAMGYGLGCLASDIPENREAMGETGHTFCSKDPDDLRQELKALLKRTTLRLDSGQAARERVSTFYSWDRIAAQLESLYAKAAGAELPIGVAEIPAPGEVPVEVRSEEASPVFAWR